MYIETFVAEANAAQS